MIIFNYHPETGAYLGRGTADESPLEPGVWLIPAYATEVEPPAAPNGECAVWAGDAWEVRQIPEADPAPTPAEKLAAAGLTVAELRELLAA